MTEQAAMLVVFAIGVVVIVAGGWVWAAVLALRNRAALVDISHRLANLELGHRKLLEIIAPLGPKPAPLPAYTPPRESVEPVYSTTPAEPRGTIIPRS